MKEKTVSCWDRCLCEECVERASFDAKLSIAARMEFVRQCFEMPAKMFNVSWSRWTPRRRKMIALKLMAHGMARYPGRT